MVAPADFEFAVFKAYPQPKRCAIRAGCDDRREAAALALVLVRPLRIEGQLMDLVGSHFGYIGRSRAAHQAIIDVKVSLVVISHHLYVRHRGAWASG